MAVEWQKAFETTTQVPSADAATSLTTGFNVIPGPGYIEAMVVRFSGTFSAGSINNEGDFGHAISKFRVAYDGVTMFDYQDAVTRASAAACAQTSRISYLTNTLGGRSYQVPIAAAGTALEYYLWIPMGIPTLKNAVKRMEVFHDYLDLTNYNAATAITSPKIEFWFKFNDAVAQSTRITGTRTWTHTSGSIEQITIPGNQSAGQMAGILVQNDSDADEFGSSGIRIIGQGGFGMAPMMLRLANGDLSNGIMGMDPDVSVEQQSYQFQVKGCQFIPLYNYAAGVDATLLIESSADTTRYYSPIFVRPTGTPAQPTPTQQASAPESVTKTILRRTDANVA